MAGKIFEMTTGEFTRLSYDCNGGICLACGTTRDYGCEPDAEGYECDECGEMQVAGVEQALLLGRITLTEGPPATAGE